MKFTSAAKCLCLVLALSTTGCTSLLVSDGQAEPDTNLTEEAQTQQLTPFELLAAELKQQPNQYLQHKAYVSQATKDKFQQALAAKQQGDLVASQQLFEELAENNNQLSGPYLQLGDLALLSNHEDAMARGEQHYQAALERNPHNYHAHNRLARLLRQQGKFQQAETHYRSAIASWPGFQPAYLNLGILYDLYLGDKAKALENYQTYQAFNAEPERRVRGWIADLSRQLATQKTSQIAEAK